MLTASLVILHSSKHILITFFSSGSKDLNQEVPILEPLKQSVSFSYQMRTDILKNCVNKSSKHSTLGKNKAPMTWIQL